MRLTATGSCASLGGWDRSKAAAMRFDEDSRTWRLDADVSSDEFPVRYKYALRAVKGTASALESGANRVIVPLGMPEEEGETDPAGDDDVTAASVAAHRRRESGEHHSIPGFPDPPIVAPMPRPGYGSGIIADAGSAVPGGSVDDVSGGSPFLAEQPGAARRSDDQSLSSRRTSGTAPSSPPASEPSPSNRWRGPNARPSRIVARDGHFRFPAPWRGSGIAVPVFSLRSLKSVGAGDFGDLETLVELVERAGMNVVQILPVNDTTVHGTWWDSYPYSSVSVFALHPLYLRVQPLIEEAAAVAGPERAHVFDALRRETERARRALDLKEVDYEATMKVKMSLARRCLKEPKVREAFLESDAFKRFLEEQSAWLRPYAVFGALRELFGTAEHWRWGALGSENALDTVSRLSSPDSNGGNGHSSVYDAVVLRYYVQFHLDAQLRRASAFAASRGVVLKGDLPIGVDKASVDTWMHPELFRMRASTGAPPDAFDANGQNWGFPTYNWDVMSEDGYKWWRRRMTHLERYFSAMRVDHVLGFFRIWELPAHARLGRLGRFRPSVPIRRHELDERGLWFIDRLCDPYITGLELRRVFGDRDGEAAGRFLEETGATSNGADGGVTPTFRFKPEFATEESLLDGDAFKIRDGSPDWLVEETRAMRAGLVALQHNVCLLRDGEDPDAFYPRIELEKTSSFTELRPVGARRAFVARGRLLQQTTGHAVARKRPANPARAHRVYRATRVRRGPRDGPAVRAARAGGNRHLRFAHPAHAARRALRVWQAGDLRLRHGVLAQLPRHDHHARVVRGGRGAQKAIRRRGAGDVRRRVSASARLPRRAHRKGERLGGVRAAGGWRARLATRGRRGEAAHEPGQRRRKQTGKQTRVSRQRRVFPSKPIRNRKRVRRRRELATPNEAPGEPPARCSPSVMRAIVRQHMASPSCLAVFPAQDLLALAEEYAATRPAEEETINDPTNNRHYWRFRLHARLEDLASDSEWLAEIRQLVDESGRNPKSFFNQRGA
jgi:4-alpha-glucanotransferase